MSTLGIHIPRHRVSADSLTPMQHRAQRNFRVHTDYYVQRLIKYDGVAEFHSYAEWLYAGLCEADPAVSTYIPQPFRVRYKAKRYVPDAYVVRDDQRFVVELKPRGEFDDAKRLALEQFFAHYDMKFVVLSNEAQLEQQQTALNWLNIVRTLIRHESLVTDPIERALLEAWPNDVPKQLSEFVDIDDHATNNLMEVAIFRLAHRGQLRIDCHDHPLDYRCRIVRCLPGAMR